MPKYTLGDVSNEVKEAFKGDKTGMPIVGLEHLTPNEVTLSSWDLDTDNTFTKSFESGDMLFGRRRAYLKKAAVAPFDGICSGDITVIRANPELLSPSLLPFLIQNDFLFDYAVEKSAGSLSPRVKWEHLKTYVLMLPKPEEQERTAEVLWSIEEACQSYKKLLVETDELVKSQFIERFGIPELNSRDFPTFSLTEVCESITDGSHTPPKGVDRSEYLMLSSKNIIDDRITFDEPRYLSREQFENEDRRTRIKAGDVLLTIVGTVGRTAVVPEEHPNIALQRSVCVLHPNNTVVDSQFLCYELKCMQQFIDAQAQGVAQRGIYLAQVGKLRIIVPEMPKQIEFVKLLQQSNKAKVVLQQALKEARALQKKIVEDNFIVQGKEN